MLENKNEKNLLTNSILRRLLIAVIIGLLFWGGLMLINQQHSSKSSEPAPDLEWSDIYGNAISLRDYRGKVVLVNNFAVWCPPCKAEMPELESYYLENKDKGFVILGIEAGQPRDVVLLFSQSMGLSFPIVLDPGMESLRAFRMNGLPNSILIDRQGMIRQAWVGAVDKTFLEKQVTPLLDE